MTRECQSRRSGALAPDFELQSPSGLRCGFFSGTVVNSGSSSPAGVSLTPRAPHFKIVGDVAARLISRIQCPFPLHWRNGVFPAVLSAQLIIEFAYSDFYRSIDFIFKYSRNRCSLLLIISGPSTSCRYPDFHEELTGARMDDRTSLNNLCDIERGGKHYEALSFSDLCMSLI